MLVILIDWRLKVRTIKFRVWNGREFIKDRYNHNHFISIADGKLVQVQHDDVCAEGFVYGNPEPVVLQQFTGLTDINGVEIYEGDIVSVAGSGACEVKICSYWGVVYVDSDGYERQHADCVSEQDYPTIIGSIHQNPELLK